MVGYIPQSEIAEWKHMHIVKDTANLITKEIVLFYIISSDV